MSSTKSKSSSSSSAKSPKPILVNADHEKATRKKKRSKKAAVVFDEDNLKYNDAQPKATMKIEEPKTPFNHEFDYERDVEAEVAAEAEAAAEAAEAAQAAAKAKQQEAAATAVDPNLLQEKLSKMSEEERKHQEFEARRKAHYAMEAPFAKKKGKGGKPQK